MSAEPLPQTFEIAIDLRPVRAQSERAGRLADFVFMATEVSREVQRVLDAQGAELRPKMQIVPMLREGMREKNGAQVIDVMMLLLSPFALYSAMQIVKLIVQLIDACRAKMPTTYEIEIGVGTVKLKVSGPSIGLQELQQLQGVIEKMPHAPSLPGGQTTPAPVIIKALPHRD